MNWDEYERHEKRGLDMDLIYCLDCNPQEGLVIEDIARVLAVHEGENDGDDWRWVCELSSGKFAFIQGGCDYTGWDCQSWASHVIEDTPEKAAAHAIGDFSGDPQNAGLGHMFSLLVGDYGNNFEAVRDELLAQLATGKSQTWREQTDKTDLGGYPKIDA